MSKYVPAALVLLSTLSVGAVLAGNPGYLPPPAVEADFRDASSEMLELGRLLFFDKVLSGNRNISCASCHHPLAHTADGLSLSVGEGGDGLSVARATGDAVVGIHERIPRNAPAVFNLGAYEFTVLFHDGRVVEDGSQPSGFRSPAGDLLPAGLDSALAVQALFPVTSPAEMAGVAGDNPVADAAAIEDLPALWELLAVRLREIPEYVELFRSAFDDIDSAADITMVHAANAIGAFEGVAWRADNSPFDRYLRGDRQAMSLDARKGMRLFYGRAGCNDCHSGTFQTDHGFHAVSVPQIGPGKGDGPGGFDDFGLERTTGDPDDRYRFRTPTLRNVALTAPYGHDGAYPDLESMVRHQSDPLTALENYDPSMAVLPPRPDLDALDFIAWSDPARRADLAAACELAPTYLGDEEVALLIEFLGALTDPASLDIKGDTPMRVPSGLPVAD